MTRLLSLGVLVGMLSACGSSPGAQASPSPSATPFCLASGPAASSWPAPSARSGTAPPLRTATLQDDTLTLTFDSGTPPFEVTAQSRPHFSLNTGKGGSIDLAGSAGVGIVLRQFRGDMQNYAGPVSLTSSGPLALQAYMTGDFEGVVAWAVSTSAAACANVTASGSTLTFHVIPAVILS